MRTGAPPTADRPSRWARRVPAVAAVVTALALGACSGLSPKLSSGTSGSSSAAHRPSSTTSSASSGGGKSGSSTAPAAPPPVTVALYFLEGGALAVSHRSVPAASPRFEALAGLFAGPTSSETSAGLTSDMPAGSSLEGLTFLGSVADVDVNAQFFNGATPGTLTAQLAQVVFTLTSFSNVDSVHFLVHSAQIANLDGLDTSGNLTRADLAGAVHDVLLESPAIGDTATNPLVVSGLAEFSGTIEMQLTDSTGRLVVDTVATAVPGETFTYSYPFTGAAAGSGSFQVFAAPASGGGAQLIATVPLTFAS